MISFPCIKDFLMNFIVFATCTNDQFDIVIIFGNYVIFIRLWYEIGHSR